LEELPPANERLRQAAQGTLEAMASALVEARNAYTQSHAQRVGAHAKGLAHRLDLGLGGAHRQNWLLGYNRKLCIGGGGEIRRRILW
jgi:HD-GYP domain-containing protein (c-di-GMP phosphodiesterase class II)